MLNRGIVLKIIPEKNLSIIFDSSKGKIYCKTEKEEIRLINGAHLEYELENKKNSLILQRIAIINDPFKLAKFDLVFFHGILQTTNSFLTLEDPNYEVFYLLEFFFYNHEKLNSKKIQKIYFCKLLSLLGICPELKQTQIYFYKLITFPIDIIVDLEIDLSIERILDFWINYVTESHPNHKNLML